MFKYLTMVECFFQTFVTRCDQQLVPHAVAVTRVTCARVRKTKILFMSMQRLRVPFDL